MQYNNIYIYMYIQHITIASQSLFYEDSIRCTCWSIHFMSKKWRRLQNTLNNFKSNKGSIKDSNNNTDNGNNNNSNNGNNNNSNKTVLIYRLPTSPHSSACAAQWLLSVVKVWRHGSSSAPVRHSARAWACWMHRCRTCLFPCFAAISGPPPPATSRAQRGVSCILNGGFFWILTAGFWCRSSARGKYHAPAVFLLQFPSYPQAPLPAHWRCIFRVSQPRAGCGHWVSDIHLWKISSTIYLQTHFQTNN